MNQRRIVISGLGCVSAFGIGVPSFWGGVVEGSSSIRNITRTQAGLSVSAPAAPIDSFSLERYIQTPLQIYLDPFAQFALLATHEAIQDARWDESCDPKQVAVVLGCTSGGEASREQEAVRLFHQGKRRCNPALVPRTNHQAAVGGISMHFGFQGPSFIVHSGCASGAHAVAQAWSLLQLGLVDYAVTGGTEANVMFSTLVAFEAMGVLAKDTCRPFSLNRTGMALGEGAGVVILETLESAQARGAPIYAELAGIGMSSDALDPVNPSAEGAALAMQRAMDSANLDPQEIGYINAHGTGTESNDAVECLAIQRVFGKPKCCPPVSSTKGSHGHALGASGGFELIVTALALSQGVLPPTANFQNLDPNCPLDIIQSSGRKSELKAALSNAFALGGLNAVLALKGVEA